MSKKKEKITEKILILMIYIYLLLPFVIFAYGWIKMYFAIPILLIVGVAVGKAVYDADSIIWLPEFTRDNYMKLIGISLCIAIWVYYSGIGAHVCQTSDHFWRNGIFEALVNHEWPVYSTNATADNSGVALIYYIGFWLPAAVVGKVFGVRAGYNFQMIWAFLGIGIMYYLICSWRKKIEVWPLIVIIFFSGLDIIGQYLMGTNVFDVPNDAHIEWWMSPYQFSSMTTQLFWVFNQAVPAWVCTMFAREQKNNRSLVLILSACLLSSTFPFIGLMVLIIYWGLNRAYKDRYFHFWRNTLTFQNIFGGGVIGIVSFLYLKGNLSATNISGTPLSLGNISWARYLIFIIIEAGIYLAVLYKYYKNRGEYYVVWLSLVLIPLLMKNSPDFCMRVSIPALFIMMLWVIDVLPVMREQRDKGCMVLLMILLTIGAVTPLHEISRAVKWTVDYQNNGSDIAPSVSFDEVMSASNFAGAIDDNFFFEYMAK